METNINIENKHKVLKPYENIKISLTIINDEDKPITIPPHMEYTPYFNKAIIGSHYEKECLEKYGTSNILKKGESISYNYEQFLPLYFLEADTDLTTFIFEINISFNQQVIVQKENIKVDCSKLIRLQTPNNGLSNYYRFDKIIFHNLYSKTKILKIDSNNFKVLSSEYIVDNQRVFNDEIQKKGVIALKFKVFNSIFAGDKNIIFTSFGNAKIRNPENFEVLDDGTIQNINGNGLSTYKRSYARDNNYLYYFDTFSTTTHATIIKPCKNPKAFKRLKYAYGKDDENVYLEGSKINKANPKRFKVLNYFYSTDGVFVFFQGKIISKVDLDSFEILPTKHYPENPDRILVSTIAKDKNFYYDMGNICNIEELPIPTANKV